MDDKDLEEAMKLFDKSKHLFLTNASSLGSGTVLPLTLLSVSIVYIL